jgi:fermentation-respiration switch protein FrsA (DUF1100 family)
MGIFLAVMAAVLAGASGCLFYLVAGRERDAENPDWLDPLPKEALVLRAEDGIELRGYYIPADRPSKRIAVVIHGHRSSVNGAENYALLYRERGFNVFAADNRAHGSSGGNFIGMGWLDRKDYLRWLDLLIEKNGPGTEILLHGISMGAAAVMMMSGEALPGEVKCVVEDCGYTSVFDEVAYQLKKRLGLPAFPLVYMAGFASKLLAGYSFTEGSALAAVKKAEVPIFFIHGGGDDYNPASMVYELYEAASCDKELWVVPGAKHGGAYRTDPEAYARRVSAFYERYMGR